MDAKFRNDTVGRDEAISYDGIIWNAIWIGHWEGNDL